MEMENTDNIYKLDFSLYGAYVYQVVGEFIDSKFRPLSDLVMYLGVRNYACIGLCERKSIREELHWQPIFSNLAGPMYNGITEDGKIIIRYETKKFYNRMSID